MAGSPKRAERRERFEAWVADPEGAMSELCEWMCEGKSLRTFIVGKDFPYGSVYEWIAADESRADRYAHARDIRATNLSEQIEDEAFADPPQNSRGDVDSGAVQLMRLRVDSIKWAASKLAPKRYGDKIEVDATVKHDVVGELRDFLAGSRLPVRPQS